MSGLGLMKKLCMKVRLLESRRGKLREFIEKIRTKVGLSCDSKSTVTGKNKICLGHVKPRAREDR